VRHDIDTIFRKGSVVHRRIVCYSLKTAEGRMCGKKEGCRNSGKGEKCVKQELKVFSEEVWGLVEGEFSGRPPSHEARGGAVRAFFAG